LVKTQSDVSFRLYCSIRVPEGLEKACRYRIKNIKNNVIREISHVMHYSVLAADFASQSIRKHSVDDYHENDYVLSPTSFTLV